MIDKSLQAFKNQRIRYTFNNMKGKSFKQKIKDFPITLKYGIQRMIKGYADEDVFNLDLSVKEYLHDVISDYLENCDSIPGALITDEYVYDIPKEIEDKLFGEWKDILNEMLTALERMNEDYIMKEYALEHILPIVEKEIGGVRFKDYDYTAEDYQNISQILINNKNKFFELFSEWFDSMWN